MTCANINIASRPTAYYHDKRTTADARLWVPSMGPPRGAPWITLPSPPLEAWRASYFIARMLQEIPEFRGAPMEPFLGFTVEQQAEHFNYRETDPLRDPMMQWGTFGMFVIEGGCSRDVWPIRTRENHGNVPAPYRSGRQRVDTWCNAFNAWRELERDVVDDPVTGVPSSMTLYHRMISALRPGVAPPAPRSEWSPTPASWDVRGSTPEYVAMGLLNLRRHLRSCLRELNRGAPATSQMILEPGDIFTVAMSFMAYAAGYPRTAGRIRDWYQLHRTLEEVGNAAAQARGRRRRWGSFLAYTVDRIRARRIGPRVRGDPHNNETHTVITALQNMYAGRYATETRRTGTPPLRGSLPAAVPGTWYDSGLQDEGDAVCLVANASNDHPQVGISPAALRVDYGSLRSSTF